MLDYTTFEDFDGHEEISEMSDPVSGLHGFIAIHRSDHGRAIGGTRVFPYQSKEEALRDVLRLSRAMTYKCAIAKLPYGGGKAVIIADPTKDKTPKLLEKYAESVQNMQKSFFTGEDVGLEQKDVDFMLQFSDFFIGKRDEAGDPSAYAALSVFQCIKTSLKFLYNTDDLNNKTVAIKGLGKTGYELVRLCTEAGAKIIAAEVNAETLDKVKKDFPEMQVVDSEQIQFQEADIYAPCALGDEFDESTVQNIKVKIICGTANNQLQNPNVGDLIFQKGITYVPDYVANAGGLINVADELEQGGYNRERVIQRINGLEETLVEILEKSKQENTATNRVADKLAESFITQKNKG